MTDSWPCIYYLDDLTLLCLLFKQMVNRTTWVFLHCGWTNCCSSQLQSWWGSGHGGLVQVLSSCDLLGSKCSWRRKRLIGISLCQQIDCYSNNLDICLQIITLAYSSLPGTWLTSMLELCKHPRTRTCALSRWLTSADDWLASIQHGIGLLAQQQVL